MPRFQPGQSGNPNGRPRNAKSTVTALRKDLITDEDLQAIVDVVIDKAKEGDLTAAGMILDRRLPRLKVNGDIGLERANLAEEIRLARERVMEASRPVIQVVTGVDGGLDGGDDTDSRWNDHWEEQRRPEGQPQRESSPPTPRRAPKAEVAPPIEEPQPVEQAPTYSSARPDVDTRPTPPQDYDPYA